MEEEESLFRGDEQKTSGFEPRWEHTDGELTDFDSSDRKPPQEPRLLRSVELALEAVLGPDEPVASEVIDEGKEK